MIDFRRLVLVAVLMTPRRHRGRAAGPRASPPVPAQAPSQQTAPAAEPRPWNRQCPAPTPPATLPTRSFTAAAGMLLIPVLSTKVTDFEKFLGHVREGLAKTTDVDPSRAGQGLAILQGAGARTERRRRCSRGPARSGSPLCGLRPPGRSSMRPFRTGNSSRKSGTCTGIGQERRLPDELRSGDAVIGAAAEIDDAQNARWTPE